MATLSLKTASAEMNRWGTWPVSKSVNCPRPSVGTITSPVLMETMPVLWPNDSSLLAPDDLMK